MKNNSFALVRLLCGLLLILLEAGPASGADVVQKYTFSGLNLVPPDGDASGTMDLRTLSSDIGRITDLEVRLSFSGDVPGGAYNGDYYIYLVHEEKMSVLLNRVGRREDASDVSAAFGYADNGFDVTLDDHAVLGDIHTYRLALSNPSSHNSPIDPTYTVGLSGIWQPDGRNINPTLVLDTDARSAPLSVFNGLKASGDWRLFVADLGSDGIGRLTGWELSIAGQVFVPEPWEGSLATAVALLGLGTCWRIRGLRRRHRATGGAPVPP